jgi:DNA-binding response OmpR family regulator
MDGRSGSAAQGARILVVEDDPTISTLVSYHLRRAGYEVSQACDGQAALDSVLSQPFDLVLMDILLPGLDGLSASREILRHQPGLPLIIVSALDDRETTLEGFRLGVEDFITKPFDLDILLARVAVSLRRPRSVAARSDGSDIDTPPRQDIGLKLDTDTRCLHTVRGSVSLTPKEYELLELLLSQPNHLFSKEELTEAVWHHRYVPSSRTLDVHVRRIRDKLQQLEAPADLAGVRGVGYRLALRGRDEE